MGRKPQPEPPKPATEAEADELVAQIETVDEVGPVL